jgi:ribokinase
VLLNPAPARPGLDPACLALLDFLVPNQGELALLTGLPTATRDEAAAAAAALRAQGPKTVIVTLGADGALLVDAAGTRHIPSVPVKPVDTTGAGDAFIGSFAHSYLAGGDVAAALPRAARYAADAIRRPGARASFADAAGFRAFCDSL